MKHAYMEAAQKLDLFHQEEHSPGFVWWHPNGMRVMEALKAMVRHAHLCHGYAEVKTPNLAGAELFERSGHLAKFGNNLFQVAREDGERGYVVRPMSCPNHIMLYADRRRSYAELPLRIFEFGEVVRDEPSGSLQALFRLRGFCQDDSHVFAAEENLQEVLSSFLALSRSLYSELGFSEVAYQISLRPNERFGADALWDRAEQALRDACASAGIEWSEEPGGGAFYGPKLELRLKDKLGREWQMGTIQLDYVLGQRFDLSYMGADGKPHVPVILHHAVLGSLERFIGVLLEQYGVDLPMALRPWQVALVSVRADCDAAVKALAMELNASGIRARPLLGDDNINNKVKVAELSHPGLIGVVGARELAQGQVNLRINGKQELVSVAELRQRCVRGHSQSPGGVWGGP